MTEKQKESIRYMRSQDFSCRHIADSLGLSYNTVKSFCYREHLTRDTRGGENDSEQDGCKNCGAPLNHRPGAKRKTFCSDRCRYTWWNRRRKYTRQKYIGFVSAAAVNLRATKTENTADAIVTYTADMERACHEP